MNIPFFVTLIEFVGKIMRGQRLTQKLRGDSYFFAEKYLTLAINSYADTVTVEKEFTDKKGVKSKRKVLVDGPKKLAARRKLMASLYDFQEIRSKEESKKSFEKRTQHINHPIIEKIFNELAPKYAKRIKETGSAGGYTRVLKTGIRKGDDAMTAIVELV